jgi:predicted phage replisome organizer
MAEKDKKYYWLKVKRDFFKRHDIQIIEDMPNGKDYILFYLKLLCESVDHEGNLRFSEEIPYNEQMLATITRTNIDVVRSAIKIFTQLNMMEIFDDGTYYMNEVQKMLGSETYWANQKRLQREQQKQLDWKMSNESPTCPSKSIDKELDKDIDIKENNKKKTTTKVFVKPSLEEVKAYCEERKNGIDPEIFIAFYESKGWKVGKSPMKNWKAAMITWENRRKEVEQPQEVVKSRYTTGGFDTL